ncbi:hypothetical protein Tco_0830529, partial [Tanacetum coccineum]
PCYSGLPAARYVRVIVPTASSSCNVPAASFFVHVIMLAASYPVFYISSSVCLVMQTSIWTLYASAVWFYVYIWMMVSSASGFCFVHDDVPVVTFMCTSDGRDYAKYNVRSAVMYPTFNGCSHGLPKIWLQKHRLQARVYTNNDEDGACMCCIYNRESSLGWVLVLSDIVFILDAMLPYTFFWISD